MLLHMVQKVFKRESQAVSPPVLWPGHTRVPSTRHASVGILQDWPKEHSHSPSEMHAMDHLARYHTKAFF